MELEKVKAKIVCDIAGCTNVAKIFVKKDKTTLVYDSLKLCPKCAGGLFKLLSKANANKEKKDGDNN